MNETHIADVVSMMTGVPVQKIVNTEKDKLANLSAIIGKSIIGQQDAVEKVVKSIQRNRAGLKAPDKPIGSFIFLGQTGLENPIGKNTCPWDVWFWRKSHSYDMSEYMEKFSISRLIGAPPGYVGYEEGGQLSEKVRRKPYSVILLDEVEKAHPDVFNMLLQVLDDGFLTDSLGRKIDFQNTIIIMTSNIGARQLKDFGTGVGFSTSAQKNQADEIEKGVIESALKKTFAPEFLNRVDDIVIFNALEKEDIMQIVDIELEKLAKRIVKLGYQMDISAKAKEFLGENGYDKKYGARPLSRAIQRLLKIWSLKKLFQQIKEGDHLKLDWDGKAEQLSLSC